MACPEIRNLVHFICKIFIIIFEITVKRKVLNFKLKQNVERKMFGYIYLLTWNGPLIWSMRVKDIPTTPATRGILICLSCRVPLLPR